MFRSSLHAPARLCALTLALGALGCSAVLNPDSDRLGPPVGVDAGPIVRIDAGRVRFDAGRRTDAGDVMCVDGATRCSGDTLLTCVGSSEIPTDCLAMGAFCDGGQCMVQVCTPNQRQCSAAGSAVVSCSASGDEISREACLNGCDPALVACRPDGPGCMVDAIEIGGSRRVNLCGRSDDNTNQMADGCTSGMRAGVGDQIYSITVDRTQEVTIELTDVDVVRAVDTLLYVRRACDDMGSQVACGDDVPCDESTAQPPACFGDFDVRQSRITMTLTPGTYYIVLDGYQYRRGRVSFSCGEVDLRVTLVP